MHIAIFCGIAFFASSHAIYAEGPTFDAASVKVFNPQLQPPYSITGGPGTNDPSRFRAAHISMSGLIERAFGVNIDQITGPAWLREFAPADNYTVVATMPPDTTKEQFQKMLQNLLVERFHLVFHRETRSFPGYELVIDKGGPKFKEVTPAQSASPDAAPDVAAKPRGPADADGFPNVAGPRTISQSRGGQVRTKYQERTMGEFVSNLGFTIGSSQGKDIIHGFTQPRVVDKTGLTGKYTFILEYYSAAMADVARQLASLPLVRTNSATVDASTPAPTDPDAGGPGIFTAVQKQLGLRLDRTKDVPLDMIMVDSVDKVPSEN